MEKLPIKVYLISGKRKSGKDYITDKIVSKLDPCTGIIIKISGPIKSHWAQTNNVSYEKLLDSTEYKEKYRKEMIKWSEQVRKKDYGYFCSAAIEMFKAHNKPLWIVSDIRRKSDIRWFKEQYKGAVVSLRIECNDEIRKSRGWVFTEGIDNGESECDLDDVNDWDIIITNDGTSDIEEAINELVHQMKLNLLTPANV